MALTNNNHSFHVLIPASGTGSRLGSDIPKQYLKISGKPILRHTIEVFLSCPGLQSLHVIINESHREFYNQATAGLDLPPPIPGGKERNHSIELGLCKINKETTLADTDKILIHDAVRPFIKQSDILKIVEALNDNQATTIGTPIQDTLRKDDNILDRNGIWSLQTPQGFHYGTIKQAHEKGQNLAVTDDTALVSALGIPIELIEGSKTNIKITTREDLQMAEILMSANYQTRTGQGFDVHAFEKGRKLVLCGVEIEHSHGLKGHSDADVALHAITDALLGAMGQGDIGEHFPPSNPEFKDMDSSIFLRKTNEFLKNKSGSIQNLDITLICEEPKITPHKNQMRDCIAQILEIDKTCVNIKATTTEGLGFTGRKEGIAAQAIATIRIKTC